MWGVYGCSVVADRPKACPAAVASSGLILVVPPVGFRELPPTDGSHRAAQRDAASPVTVRVEQFGVADVGDSAGRLVRHEDGRVASAGGGAGTVLEPQQGGGSRDVDTVGDPAGPGAGHESWRDADHQRDVRPLSLRAPVRRRGVREVEVVVQLHRGPRGESAHVVEDEQELAVDDSDGTTMDDGRVVVVLSACREQARARACGDDVPFLLGPVPPGPEVLERIAVVDRQRVVPCGGLEPPPVVVLPVRVPAGVHD